MDADRLAAARLRFELLDEDATDRLLERAGGGRGPGLTEDEWLVVALIALDQAGGDALHALDFA